MVITQEQQNNLEKLNEFCKGMDLGITDGSGNIMCVGDKYKTITDINGKWVSLGGYPSGKYGVGEFIEKISTMQFSIFNNHVAISLPVTFAKHETN